MTAVPEVQDHLAPSRIGQATAVEQSRAIAEVQAAIVVAQQCPRDITRAVRAMRQSCAQKSLAEQAFYSFPRAGETITGPSVQLARELARCFGNIQYGISELRRDDPFGQSEMLAFAWDVETNTRSSTTFIVPHRRDTKKGVKVLTDMRDVYENNANNGARRLREMIFAILPAWFTEDAAAECYETIADEGGVPMAERIASAIKNYAALKVTEDDLERKLGAPSGRWSAYDVARLGVVYRSLMRGEARKEDEFPSATAGVTPAEVLGSGPPPPPQDRRPNPDIFHADAEAAALLAREGLTAERETRTAKPPPAAQPKRHGSKAAGELVRQLTQIPLGEEADVAAFISWKAGRETTLPDLIPDEVTAISAYLAEALEVAAGNVTEAASAVWTDYRTEHPGQAALPAGENSGTP